MKKTIFLSVMMIAVVCLAVSGTFAIFSQNVSIQSGNVLSKNLIFDIVGDQNFQNELKLESGSIVNLNFSTRNFKNQLVTDLRFDSKVEIAVVGAEQKKAIPTLSAKLFDENGKKLRDFFMKDGEGSVEISEYFGKEISSKNYVVQVEWKPSIDDEEYLKPEYGNIVLVNGVATQCTHDHSNDIPQFSTMREQIEFLGDKVFDNRKNLIDVGGKHFDMNYKSNVEGNIYYINHRTDEYMKSANKIVNFCNDIISNFASTDIVDIYFYGNVESSFFVRITYYYIDAGGYTNQHFYEIDIDAQGNVSRNFV